MTSSIQQRVFLPVIIIMSSVGLFASDIYLPALPEMAAYFDCSQGEILDSFTVFLMGLAMCQLTSGILADKFGRKKIILIGLGIFSLASFFCTFAHSLPEFIICRLLQAIGGGVGSVVSRAIVATRYDRKGAVKVFSTIFPFIGLSSAIAPFIGGYLTHLFHWQATFYFMTGFGAVAWILVASFLEDTRVQVQADSEKIKSVSGYYFSVLKNWTFIGYAAVICAGFSAFRFYAAASPFVFDNQGFVAREMGHFYVFLSAAYVLGNLFAKRLINFMTVDKALSIGFLFFVAGGLSMIPSAIYFESNPYAIILPMAVVTLGNGFLFPLGSAAAMSSVPGSASGMASGLMGALQFGSAALCIHWVGELCQGQALSMSYFLTVIIFMGLCSFLFLRSRAKLLNA